ncbi:MAG TPA: hypothetical protein VK904_06925 [Miltoncostaeaceae bacterium]|nr:hypothetical protein [Miltoncostaeaceae bacterium]
MFAGLIPRWLLVTALILIAAGAAAFVLWRSAGSSSPVSEESALSSFREAGGAGAAPRAGVPRSGVYTYRQSGEETGGAGPLDVTRDLPDEARYVVTPTGEGFQEELSLSEQHIEGVRFRVTAEGSRAVWRRTDVTFLGIGRDDRRDLRPPPLHLPRRLAVGRAWSGRYVAGELPVSYRSEVLRREPVEVGGERLPALVVRTVGDTGGAHPGRRVDTFWWSPRLALPLRWTIDMEIRGTVSLDTTADLRLEAAEPLT